MNSKKSLQQEALTELEIILQNMIATPMGRRKFLASVGFLMASCASPSQHRHREGDNTGQSTDLTPDDERRMTAEVLPKMRKDYPPVQDPQLQTYISGLGQRLVTASNLQGRPYNYNFTVVDVDYVNAFALPAGTVFVTAPLIAMADSEAELAGVVGHEIGHIQARHTAERMAAAKKAESKSAWYAIGGGLIGAAAGYGLGKLMCRKNDDECMAKAATYGAAAGAGGGLLIQKYAFMANSREDEMEADRIGFRVASKGGYDKDHVGKFYAKLLQMEKSAKGQQDKITAALTDALSTHPPSEERVRQMSQMAAETSKSPKAIVSSRSFDKFKKVCVNLKAGKRS